MISDPAGIPAPSEPFVNALGLDMGRPPSPAKVAAPADAPEVSADAAAPAALPGARAARLEWLLLALVAAVQLLAVWGFRFFPSTDGPAHLANADVLVNYFRPAGATYHAYYEIVKRPLPNALGHLGLAVLLAARVPPLLAEKLLLTVYVLAFPLALRYALRAVRPASGFLALLALPLAYGYLLHKGFYNFDFSLVFFCLLLGYWLRHRARTDLPHAVRLTGLSLLLFACHVFSLTMACLSLALVGGVMAAVVGAHALRRGGPRAALAGGWRGLKGHGLVTLYALLPALILAAEFSLNLEEKPGGSLREGLRARRMWADLLSLSPAVVFRKAEAWGGLALAALIGGAVLYALVAKARRRAATRWDGLALLPLAFALLYFRYSDVSAALLFIPTRLIVYTALGLLLWLAGQEFGPRARHALSFAAVAVAVALVALRVPAYRRYNEQLAEFVSVKDYGIRPGSTILPLLFSPRGCPQDPEQAFPGVVPFFSATGYVAAETHAVDLHNYEAMTDHFPVRFRPGLNPKVYLALPLEHGTGFDVVPQQIDIAGYERRTGGRVDYVIVWAAPPAMRDYANAVRQIARCPLLIPPPVRLWLYPYRDTMALFDQLERGFERVPLSRQHQRVQLWRHK